MSENQSTYDLIKRYVEGKLTEVEASELFQRADADDKVRQLINDEYELFRIFKEIGRDESLARIKYIENNSPQKTPLTRIFRFIRRIRAAIWGQI